MNLSLEGKRIFIAGATGAIGRAVVETVREAGAWVGGSYFQNEEQARIFQTQGIFMKQADLTDRTQAKNLMKDVLEEAGHLDAFVYAAGNTRDHLLTTMTDEEWDQVMDLHVKGLMACVQAILPGMQKQKAGKLIAVTSHAGLTGRIGQSNYSAAKAATIAFIKSVAREAGRFGVTANVISPGFIDSHMTRSAPPEAWDRAKAASALGTVSSAQVVASFVTWFLSDVCHGVTGQLFCLDSRIL